MSYALKFENVSKSYGKIEALKNLNLEIRDGEKVAILGNNGAGKSTFLNLAVGFYPLSSGSIAIEPSFAYLPQNLSFPGFLKVADIIRLMESNAGTQISHDILKKMGLDLLLQRYCHALSGENRKLAFAISLLGDKRFLILDEPTANIDMISRRSMHEILHERSAADSGKTLLFSSHDMSDIENLANRIIILHKGTVVADGNVASIKANFSPMKISFKTKILNLNFLSSIKTIQHGNTYFLYGTNSDDMLKEVITRCPDAHHIEIKRSDLEEALLTIWEKT